jgi:hypothetical protein
MSNACLAPACRSASSGSRHVSDRPVCAACRDHVASRLRELPALYHACASALECGRSSTGERVSGWWPRGISLNQAAFDARIAIEDVLADWCAMVVDERGITGPPGGQVPRLASFLADQLDWLTVHCAATDFPEEIERLAAAARDALDPHPRLPAALGACIEPGCGQPIRATSVARVPQVACDAGHTWQPHQWLQLRRRMSLAAEPAAQPRSSDLQRTPVTAIK